MLHVATWHSTILKKFHFVTQTQTCVCVCVCVASVSALKSRLLLPLQINLSNCIHNSLFFFALAYETVRCSVGGAVVGAAAACCN